jgi:O-antigen/teichoic acid export membrane protein
VGKACAVNAAVLSRIIIPLSAFALDLCLHKKEDIIVLKKRLGHSTLLMSLAASGNSVISFIIFIVLSRILSPAEIGLVAFALIIIEAGKIIVNAGFPHAIVQHAVWDESHASTCFYLNLLFAFAVALFVLTVGVPLAVHYYEPEAKPLLQALSVIFFIEGIKAVHEGKLKREFAFRVIALRTVIGGLAGGAVGIYLALNGFGVWALVWQQLVNHSLVSILTITSARWRPKFTFSLIHCKHLIGFSSPLMFAQLIGNVSAKTFDLMIGIVIGPTALGFFRVGGRVLYILQDVVLKPFEQTALSALSRLQELPQKAAGTLRLIRMSAFITFPIFFGAAALGPEFIIFAFGEKWAESGNLMTVLAVGSVPMVISYQVNAALTASGHSRMVMILATISFIVNLSLAFISVPLGLFVAACGFALRSYLTIFANMYFFKKVYGTPITSILKTVAPAFFAALVMFETVLTTKLFLLGHFSPLLDIVLLALLGVITYITLMFMVFRVETRNFLTEGVDLLPEKIKPAVMIVQRFTKLK